MQVLRWSNFTYGNPFVIYLTHLPLVPHICVSELNQHWFRQCFVAYWAPSHYLNQYWVIVNWSLRNKLQWNLNQNTTFIIHKNVSENIVCEMAAILSRLRWVKLSLISCAGGSWLLSIWPILVDCTNNMQLEVMWSCVRLTDQQTPLCTGR